MTEVPKIVHHRLRAGGRAAAGMHPEADVLTAFAEQSLSQAEREGVLTHLAACGDCREVVLLALPEVADLPKFEPESEPTQVLVPFRARRNWFAWGNSRWAALAAGIAVAVLIVRPGMEHKPTPAVTAVESKPASPATQPPSAAVAADSKTGRVIDEAPTEVAGVRRQGSPNKNTIAPEPAKEPAAGFLVAGNMKKDVGRFDNTVAAPVVNGGALDQPRSMSETVEVTSASGAPSAPAAADQLMAKLEAPAIEKAKAARDEEGAAKEQKLAVPASRAKASLQASNDMAYSRAYSAPAAAMMKDASTKPIAQWKIAQGTLQRSFDRGQSWQSALKATHVLLCSANRGVDVWAGGQAGTLLHSKDGGMTWDTVEASSQGQTLKSDVTQIGMSDAEDVVLTTADHQTWHSTDGGKTWEKK